MKKVSILFVLFWILNSCEKPSECVESAGKFITKSIVVQPFKNIKVYKGIELVIAEGTETKVEILAGENFIDNIQVIQNDDQLIFKDETSCNWVREYGKTKIFITTPTLENVYSKSDRDISSNGVLTFPVLRFLSLDKDADGENGAGTGDFFINVNNSQLVIENNNISRFYLSGQTQNAFFNFYFGDGRIEAQNLIAQNISIYHRGSNDMIVNPIQKVSGVLNSTGNLILKNVPPIVDIDELYQGNVIYP